MKTTREKVIEWLEKAPEEIKILHQNNRIEELTNNLMEIGIIMPKILRNGYLGKIEFSCEDWE